MESELPLILTLRLNEEAFFFFDKLRQQYFPAERNFLAAHLTLFHHLPANESSIEKDIITWSQNGSLLYLLVTDVVSIGKGVAFKIECPALLQLHKRMKEKWQAWLIPQDKQKLWPHITVQNKVTPQKAKETLLQLKQTFQPFTAIGTGLALWRYDGGPWTFLRNYSFVQ